MKKMYSILKVQFRVLSFIALLCSVSQIRAGDFMLENNKVADPIAESKVKTNNGIIVDQQEISGTVFDDNGIPLSGASILEKGTTNGVQSGISDFVYWFCNARGCHYQSIDCYD